MPPAATATRVKTEPMLGSAPRSLPIRAETTSDAELVAAVRRGERWAEERLYRRHVQAVTAVAIRLLGRSAEAEDVVQDSFITALERIGQLQRPELLRAWLLTITIRQVHRHFRRRRMLKLLGFDRGDDDASLERLAAPSLPTDARAELARVDGALRTLPAGQRVAWVLRHVEGYELTEVATACEVSLATVKRWLDAAQRRVALHARGEVRHG